MCDSFQVAPTEPGFTIAEFYYKQVAPTEPAIIVVEFSFLWLLELLCFRGKETW
jgi:hypothetical protein